MRPFINPLVTGNPLYEYVLVSIVGADSLLLCLVIIHHDIIIHYADLTM